MLPLFQIRYVKWVPVISLILLSLNFAVTGAGVASLPLWKWLVLIFLIISNTTVLVMLTLEPERAGRNRWVILACLLTLAIVIFFLQRAGIAPMQSHDTGFVHSAFIQ